MKKSKLAKILGVGAFLLSSALHAEFGKEDKLESIESMRDIFNILYAPKEWKEVYNNVYFDVIFDYDRLRVLLDPNLTLPLFQQEIQRSVQDIEDYHVGMRFTSTELAYLPFSVVVVNDQFFPRYFVSHVYVEDYPLSVGDELLSFDGKPIYWVINKLRREGGYQNRRQTDHRILAESILTVRQRSRGFEVPKGELMVEGIRQADGKIVSYELNWQYRPEQTLVAEQNSSVMAESDDDLAGVFEWPELKYDDQQVHLEDLVEDATVDQNPYQLGGRKSYIPALGEIVEEAPEESIFYWYIFKGEDGKNYGYLRLPSYDGSVANYNAFGQAVNRLEANTEKLILDQNHNPGGSLLYLYALASMFADGPLEVPYHQEKTVAFTVQEIEQALTLLDAIDSDEGAKEIFGDSIHGYNVDLKFAQGYSAYLRGVLSEKLAGKELTQALPIVGIEKIEPNTTYRYTKPVILLTDALCFSGGDFFPAIMQDNDRMLLVGQNTAGAGGYVNQIEGSEFPASIKISSIRYTGSLAWRSNGFPIESIGVKPDVIYQPKVSDIKLNYDNYKKKILKLLETHE